MKAIRIVLYLVPDITHVYHSQNYDNLRPKQAVVYIFKNRFFLVYIVLRIEVLSCFENRSRVVLHFCVIKTVNYFLN